MGIRQGVINQLSGQKIKEEQQLKNSKINQSYQFKSSIQQDKLIERVKQIQINKNVGNISQYVQKKSKQQQKIIRSFSQQKLAQGQMLKSSQFECNNKHQYLQKYQNIKNKKQQKQTAKIISFSQSSSTSTETNTSQQPSMKIQQSLSSYQSQQQFVKKIDQHSQIVFNMTYTQQTQTIKFNYFYKLNGKIIDFLKVQPQMCYLLVEELELKCPQFLPYLLYQIIFKSLPTQSQLLYTQKKSQIYKKCLKQYKKYQFGDQKCEVPMILLKHFIQSPSRKLYFQEEQDMRTTLSMKNIFTGFMSDYYVFRQKSQEDDIYRFQIIANPSQRKLLQQYVYNLKKDLAKKYKTKIEDIYVFQLKKGSIDAQCAIKKQLYELFKFKDVTFAQLFSQYRLSQRNFDPYKNNKFQDWLNQQDLLIRGSFPYYPPVYCKRYALNVSKRYQNDTWLSHQKKKPGVWAVGMHGSFIHTKISPIQNIIQSMMQGFQTNNMLKIGQHHVYQDFYNCRGKKSQTDHEHVTQKIGKGIYLTPYYQMALKYGSYNEKTKSKLNKSSEYNNQQNQIYWNFNIVIQTRIHPNYIKIPLQRDNHNVWVVPQSRFIRPYGILVSVREDYQKQLNYLCNQDTINFNKNDQRRYIGVRYKREKRQQENGQIVQFNPFQFNYYLMREQIQTYCKASF